MSIERGGKHIYISEHTGKQTSSYEKRNEMATMSLGSAAYIGEQALTLCPVCFNYMTHNGSSIDHIVSKGQLLADGVVLTAEAANEKVGHPSNLLTACAGCNSSKNGKDLFAWWRSDLSKSYLQPCNRDRVINILDELYRRTSKTYVTHFPFGEYQTVVFQIQKKVLTGC
ncbi:hypothetical protein DOJK_01008 [Patescibacteria group bacterium]|nr:hypothetical protein DOJK_01008 [Patescibacteria group bacterium]